MAVKKKVTARKRRIIPKEIYQDVPAETPIAAPEPIAVHYPDVEKYQSPPKLSVWKRFWNIFF